MSEEIRIDFCPHCGNHTPQTLALAQPYLYEEMLDCAYLVLVCGTCSEILIYDEWPYEGGPHNLDSAHLVWPKTGTLPLSVPDSIGDIYNEAALIKHKAPNAFAGQIRRALEALCRDRGARGSTLQKKLQQLADNGEVPPVLAEMTEILRMLGNMGVHSSDQEVKQEYATVIDEFFRAIVEYVYVAPAKVKDFQNRLKEIEEEDDIVF